MSESPRVEPVKDEGGENPVPDAWRPALREIVHALVQGDYGLARDIPGVAPVSPETAEHMRAYVSGYGETLAELSDETWNSSVAQWIDPHWEVIVDLWTVESGRSDMVLHVMVFETESSFRFEIDCVYVP